MKFSIEDKEDLEAIAEVAKLKELVKEVRLEEKLGEQCFIFDSKEFFEPTTKAVTDKNEKLPEVSSYTTKAIEYLNESNVHVKDFELMNEKGVISPVFKFEKNIIVKDLYLQLD